MGSFDRDAAGVAIDRTAASGVLKVSLVEGCSLEVAGRMIDLRRRKPLALLGYLVLSEEGAVSRERLLGLLWSEVSEANARTSLRQTLHHLRNLMKESGFTGLHVDKLNVALDRRSVVVDVWSILRAAEGMEVHPALLEHDAFSERLLAAFDDIDPAYRTWLMARRQSIHLRLSRAMEAIIVDETAADAEKVRAAEALVNLDPTHEEAIRYLMRFRALAGNIGGALKLYGLLWDLLDEDFGMEPSVETQNLVAAIKSGEYDQQAIPTVVAEEGRPVSVSGAVKEKKGRLVLAIEPFNVGSDLIENPHLLVGFRHFLIAAFVRFREWRVMDLSRPFAEGGPGSPDFLVQATTPGTGSEALVVLTIKELSTGYYIWSESFDLRAEGWIKLQQRVVRSVLTAMNVHLSANRMARLSGGRSIEPGLYDSWLRGQMMILRLDPEDWEKASTLFEEVIEQAPDFAPAYSSLVQLKNSQHIVHPGIFRDPHRQQEALRLAQSAVQLDPIDSRTQLCLAWASAFDGQYDTALLHFDLARELNELDPWTLLSVAQGFAFLGEDEKAKRLAVEGRDNCIELQPIHWGYLAGIHYFTGAYEEALKAAEHAGDFLPNNGAWRAASLVRLGDLNGARREAIHCINCVRSRWKGNGSPSDTEIALWVYDLFPVRDSAKQENLRQDLVDAGFALKV